MYVVHGQIVRLSCAADSPMPKLFCLDCLEHKEKARESCPCLSRHSGSRIAFPPKISNTEAHAHNDTPYIIKGVIGVMDANHCLIVWRNEFARFEWPQIKRQSNVFSICLSPSERTSDERHRKITLFLKPNLFLGKKKSFFCLQRIKICLQPCGIFQKKALSAELKAFFGEGYALNKSSKVMIF